MNATLQKSTRIYELNRITKLKFAQYKYNFFFISPKQIQEYVFEVKRVIYTCQKRLNKLMQSFKETANWQEVLPIPQSRRAWFRGISKDRRETAWSKKQDTLDQIVPLTS